MHLAKYHHKKQTLFLRKSIPLGQKNHGVARGGSANCRIWCDTTRGWWVRAAQGRRAARGAAHTLSDRCCPKAPRPVHRVMRSPSNTAPAPRYPKHEYERSGSWIPECVCERSGPRTPRACVWALRMEMGKLSEPQALAFAARIKISLSCSSFLCFSIWSSCSKNLSWARTSLACSYLSSSYKKVKTLFVINLRAQPASRRTASGLPQPNPQAGAQTPTTPSTCQLHIW